jgi:hypothetical protein
MSCKDVIKEISDVLLDKFKRDNFILKNNVFEKTISVQKKYQYIIDVKKCYSGHSLHLILKLVDKYISNNVNTLLKKTLLDKEMIYPKNWTQKDIDYSIKIRTKNNTILSLTDWRIFKQENEPLDEFVNNFSIWFCTFNNIEEKGDWENQLYKSFEYSKMWFKMADNEKYIIENTIYESLYLQKINNRMDYINEMFQKYKEKSRNNNELKIFCKYLME